MRLRIDIVGDQAAHDAARTDLPKARAAVPGQVGPMPLDAGRRCAHPLGMLSRRGAHTTSVGPAGGLLPVSMARTRFSRCLKLVNTTPDTCSATSASSTQARPQCRLASQP